MLTISDAPSSLDVTKPPEHPQMVRVFLHSLFRLLNEKKSMEVMPAIELFSKTSIVTNFIHFYRAIELFSMRKAETVLAQINDKLRKSGIKDDLIGLADQSVLVEFWSKIIDSLAHFCATKSRIHVYRFLCLLQGSVVSPFLERRVKLCESLAQIEGSRRALVVCDLLGDFETIVSDLALTDDLQIGKLAADCLGIASTVVTTQWITFKYSTVLTPIEALEVHREIVRSVEVDVPLFISLIISLLTFAQPTSLLEVVESAVTSDDSPLSRRVRALHFHLKMCKENGIEVIPGSEQLSGTADLIGIVFPGFDFPAQPIRFSLVSPVLFGIESLQQFFDSDRVLDMCLDDRRVDDARHICEWRNRATSNVDVLEVVQKLLNNEDLNAHERSLIGESTDMQSLLDALAGSIGWRFSVLCVHHEAAVCLGVPTTFLCRRTTTEFLESSLAVTAEHWPLVRRLIAASRLPMVDIAYCLGNSFLQHISTAPVCNDYGDKFAEFARLVDSPRLLGDRLLSLAGTKQPPRVAVNLLLHASLCCADLDECADALDNILDRLDSNLIVDVASVFPEPSLVPRFFQFTIENGLLGSIKLSRAKAKVVLNCARHGDRFEPEAFCGLASEFRLDRDYAELQMLSAMKLVGDKTRLAEAKKHLMLALSHFLLEKCYSLAMDCLKRLALISLQSDAPEIDLMSLDKSQVLKLMSERDFPFALTVAVAYNMDVEANWADAIYAHSIADSGEDFLAAFQYFRPITSNLCEGIVRRYRAGPKSRAETERLK
jgi:spatacsin